MLRTLFVNRARGNFFCERLALATCEHAVFDVLILALALCAPIGRRHDDPFQWEPVKRTGERLVGATAHIFIVRSRLQNAMPVIAIDAVATLVFHKTDGIFCPP